MAESLTVVQPNSKKKPALESHGGGEALAFSTPNSKPVNWPRYGMHELTHDKVLFTFLPRPDSTTIATTAISARINAYSTKLWPFRDFSPRYIFWRVLFISFTSFACLMFNWSTTRLTYDWLLPNHQIPVPRGHGGGKEANTSSPTKSPGLFIR